MLHYTEDAVERVYNSGRFRLAANYVLNASGQTPFEFYLGLGIAAHEAGVRTCTSSDDYTAVFEEYCASLENVDKEALRDFLVRDRLSTNSTGRLPPCLYRQDAQLAKVIKRLSANPATAPQKGVRRGVALLYTAKAVCWADYVPEKRNPVTGRWVMHEMPLSTILA